jgi:hypothetical protein
LQVLGSRPTRGQYAGPRKAITTAAATTIVTTTATATAGRPMMLARHIRATVRIKVAALVVGACNALGPGHTALVLRLLKLLRYLRLLR